MQRNLPIPDVLSLQRDHASDDGRHPNTPLALVYDAWNVRLEQRGMTFADAIAPWVPPEHAMLIRSGERVGDLSRAFALCAYLDESIAELTGSLRKAFSYPIFLVIMVLGLLAFIGTVVTPALEGLVPPERWTGVAATFPAVFGFLLGGGIFVVLAVLGLLVAAYRWTLPRWHGPGRQVADLLFPFSIYRKFRGAEFLLAFAAQLQVRTEALDACTEMRRYATPWMRWRLDKIIAELHAGEELSDAIWRADRFFPDPELVREVRSVMHSADFTEQIQRLAREFVQTMVGEFTRLEGTFRNVGLAAVVGIIVYVVAGMKGIFDMATAVF